MYHYMLFVQMNPVKLSPSHSATASQSFRFSLKIFIKSALAWGPKKVFYHWGPNLLLVALSISRMFVILSENNKKKKNF
jgi:hypothetical protein